MTQRMLPVALLFIAAILAMAPAAADEVSPGRSLAAPIAAPMAGGGERIGSDRLAPAAQNDDRASQKLISEGRKMPANRGASSGGGSHTDRQA